jgi:uncharacterized protein (DUF302 family)
MTDAGTSIDLGGITTKPSPRSVADTVSRLVELIEARGMKVFAVIDPRRSVPASPCGPRPW